MHKGVILLLKANNREDVISKVNGFMEQYGNGNVWDWWRIGGRWMNAMAPMDKIKEYNKLMKELLGWVDGQFGYSTSELEKNRDKLQEIWENLGLKGKHPYYYNAGFSFDMPEDGEYYDILPLSEAIDKVIDWTKEIENKAEEYFNDMLKAREEDKDSAMSAYYAKRYAELKCQEFSFECNIYNIEKNDFSIPKEFNGWYACMIDMHN